MCVSLPSSAPSIIHKSLAVLCCTYPQIKGNYTSKVKSFFLHFSELKFTLATSALVYSVVIVIHNFVVSQGEEVLKSLCCRQRVRHQRMCKYIDGKTD
jgi:hypothetical protein